jgi:hypothetical protein
MKYIKWVVLAILDILFNLFAYLTNPLVLLFADTAGNLPSIFRWWENWDDHLDIDWMIDEGHVPRFARYDFHRHYKYHPPEEAEVTIGEYRGYVDILDGNFTLLERFQRYICRLIWLYRNCAYGFSYHVTGIDIHKNDIVKVKTNEKDGYIWNITDYAFCYKDERPSLFGMHWDNFIGWKFQNVTKDVERCMLAFRITPFCNE